MRLAIRSSSGRGGLFGLELVSVVLHEVTLLGVTVPGTELILVHLGQRLIEVPVIVVEAINSSDWIFAKQ